MTSIDRAATRTVAYCYHLPMAVNMHIREVDESVHRELVRRADAAGMTLRAYVIDVLQRHTAMPNLDTWLDEVRADPPLPAGGPDSVTLIEEGGSGSDAG